MTSSTATASTGVPVNAASITLASLHRLSGLILVVGCALMAAGDVLRVISGPDPAHALLAVGWFGQAAGAALVILGLPGFCVRIAGTGVLGVAGLTGIAVFLFYFGIFGGLLHALAVPGLIGQGATRPHPVDIGFLLSAIVVMLGSLALGAALLRGRLVSPGAPALLIVGGVALVAGHPIAHVEDAGLLLLMAGLGWAASPRSALGSFAADSPSWRPTAER